MADDEKVWAKEMIDALDPFEPTPEIWKTLGAFFHEITERHGTTHCTVDVLVSKSNKVANAKEIAIVCFTLMHGPEDTGKIREYAVLPLDDNRKAFGFLPVRDDDESDLVDQTNH